MISSLPVRRLLAGVAVLGAAAGVAAAPQGFVLADNQVPSCYVHNPKVGQPAPAPLRHVFVLVDETTKLNDALTSNLLERLGAVLKASTAITIARFSAFSQGHYSEITFAGAIEHGLPESVRNSVSIPALRPFDECLAKQLVFAREKTAEALQQVLKGADTTFARSEILASLAELARVVRETPAPQRSVVIVSDMLEHSSQASFYANNTLRQLDADKEIRQLEAKGRFADFGKAAVYVLGAALLPGDSTAKGVSAAGRDSERVIALKQFWTEYFKRSNAELIEFGTPALLLPLR